MQALQDIFPEFNNFHQLTGTVVVIFIIIVIQNYPNFVTTFYGKRNFPSWLSNCRNPSNHYPLLYSQMMPSIPPSSLSIPGSPKQSAFHKSLIQQSPMSPSKKRNHNSQNSASSPFMPISPLSATQIATPNSDNDSSRNPSGGMYSGACQMQNKSIFLRWKWNQFLLHKTFRFLRTVIT